MQRFTLTCPACGHDVEVKVGGQAPAVLLRARDVGVAVECPNCRHQFTFRSEGPPLDETCDGNDPVPNGND